jgi:hypothetical protein
MTQNPEFEKPDSPPSEEHNAEAPKQHPPEAETPPSEDKPQTDSLPKIETGDLSKIQTGDLSQIQTGDLSKAAPPPSSSAVICPTCAYANRPGLLVCDNCGTSLVGAKTVGGTRVFGEGNAPKADVSGDEALSAAEAEDVHPTGEAKEIFSSIHEALTPLNLDSLLAVTSAGTTTFDSSMVLRLEIEGAPTPILLYPKAENTIGRRDPSTGTMPDVDLTAYAGYRMGVSRRHATIRAIENRLEVRDLGSSNGTSVNGVRLTPHQPHILRDGDELALGKMVIRVIFQIGSSRH